MTKDKDAILKNFFNPVNEGLDHMQANRTAKRAQEDKLAQLLKADELKAAGTARDTEAVIGLSSDPRFKDRPLKVGDASVGGAQEGMNLLGLLNLQERQQNAVDRKVREVADRTEKEGIPQMAPALHAAKAKFQGKSVGPIMNMLPTSVQGVAANLKSRAGEALGKDDWKGAGEEFQELQRLMNIDIRQFAGAAQTQMETAKQMIEKGIQAGGSKEQVKRGMQMMQEALNSSAQNIQGGTNPAILQEYAKRYGGKTPLEIAESGPVGSGGGPKDPSAGPHGKSVVQGGVTYTWNPETQSYE